MSHKISTFDRSNLRDLRASTEAALREVGAKFGVTFDIGAIRFSPNECRCTVTAKVGAPQTATEQADAARQEFARYCQRFGLQPEHFGRTFRCNNSVYTICGIKPNSPKFPILARSLRGTIYKFGAEQTGFVSAKDAELMREAAAELRAEAKFS